VLKSIFKRGYEEIRDRKLLGILKKDRTWLSAARLDQAIVLLALSFSFSQYHGLRVFFTLLPVIKLIKDH
jgi:hypothetical protein